MRGWPLACRRTLDRLSSRRRRFLFFRRRLFLRTVVLLDAALERRTAGRLVDAIREGAQFFSSKSNLFVCLLDQRGLLPAVPRAARLFIEGQRVILKCLGLVEDREAMARFLFRFRRVLVVPAVRAADGEAIVFAG